MNSLSLVLVLVVQLYFSSSVLAKSKTPCNELEPLDMTEECVRTYKCPAKPKPKDGVLIGVLLDGQMVGATLIKKDNRFMKVDPSFFSGLKNVYVGKNLSNARLTYYVSYDAVESNRCDFIYYFEPLTTQSGPLIVTSDKSAKVDLSINPPSEAETKIFEITHSLCKKKTCHEEGDWNQNKLYAVTDLNKNHKKEYWYFYVYGYRTYYKAEELDSKTNAWETIYSF